MVRLTVVHEKLKVGSEMERKIASGWARVLSSMKSFLETGAPLNTWVGHEYECGKGRRERREPMTRKMTTDSRMKQDFRAPTESKKIPKAVADGIGGMILATVEVTGAQGRVFRALTTNEIEKWWKFPGVYHLKDWMADLQPQGRWSVTVELNDGKQVHEWGEFCELVVPHKIVMTRRFGGNPLLGERETTLTYRLEPSPHGTLVTVREEGFIGRPKAAYGNAENWEKVLGWLAEYFVTKN